MPRERRHDRFSRVADPAVLYWTHAVETTTNRRPVGGGHTAAGHGLVTGVLAGSVSPLGSSRRTPIRDAPGRSGGQGEPESVTGEEL